MRRFLMILGVILTLIIVNSIAATAQLSNVVPSSAAPVLSNSNTRTLFKDSLGNYYVTFYASYYGYNRIFVRKSEDNGSTWKIWNGTAFVSSGSEVPVDNSGNYNQNNPSIWIDKNDNIHIVWAGLSSASPSSDRIRYSRLQSGGGTWTSSINIASAVYEQEYPSIAVDSTNNVHVVWGERMNWYGNENHLRYIKSNDGGITWGSPTSIETYAARTNSSPAIEVDNNDNVYVVWVFAGLNFYFSKSVNKGASWSGASVISGVSSKQIPVSIAVDRNNNIHGIFINGTNDLYYSKLPTGTYSWTTPTLVYTANDILNASIAIDNYDNIQVLMQANIGGVNQILYTWSRINEISWSTPSNITTGSFNQVLPSFEKRANGYLWTGTTDNAGVSSNTSGLMFKDDIEKIAPFVTTPVISDTGDNLDARDMQLVFNGAHDETNISEYRVIVVPTSQAGSFTEATASGLSSDRYEVIAKNGNNGIHSLTLSQTLKDSNGAAIVNNVSYKVFVQSIGANSHLNNISAASNALILESPVPAVTGLSGTDISDIGDGTDLRVDFTGAIDETNIQEYRVFIVPAPLASTFDRTTAEGLGASYYILEPTNGNNAIHSLTLERNTLDVAGGSLGSGGSYKIFVLSIQKNGYTNSLSAGSAYVPLNVANGPSQVTGFTSSLSNNNARVIAKDSFGNYYLTFYMNYNGYTRIFVRKSVDNGLTWKYWNGSGFGVTGSEVPVENMGNVNQLAPAIGIDGSDNIYLVWSNNNVDVRYSKLPNGSNTWTAPVNIMTSGYSANNPSIAIDNNNYIHVAWQGRDYYYNVFTSIAYTKSINGGSTWAATNYVSPNSSYKQYPSIEVDSNNNVYITWDISSTNVFYIKSANSGTSWQTEARINSDGRNYKSSALAVDRIGNVHAVFIDKATNDLYYSRLPNGASTWSTPILIYNTNDAIEPTIAVDKNDVVHVLWNASIGGVNQIMYSWASNVGITWSAPVALTTGTSNQTKPSFIKDASGYVWLGTTDNSKASVSSTGLTFYNFIEKVAPNVSVISISDTADNLDARDLQVTFSGAHDETNISEYRIFVIPTSQAGTFTESTAEGLASDKYVVEAKNGNNGSHIVNLTQTLKDSTGTPIVNNISYKVFILSIGNNSHLNNLSAGSNALILESPVPTVTALIGADIADVGDGTDFRITFTGASDEMNIQEYRVFVVPAPNVSTFNRAVAESLSASYYTLEPTAGNGSGHSLTLSRNTIDTAGGSIGSGGTYKVFVLGIQKNGYTNSLSAGSSDVLLNAYSTPSQVTGFTSSLSNNNARVIAKDSLGNYYVTFYMSYNGYNRIFVRKSADNGLTWKYWNGSGFGVTGAEVPVENMGNVNQLAPAIGIDGSNNIHLVWSNNNADIRYSKLANGSSTWSAPVNIMTSGYSAYNPSIAIDNNSYIHVAWHGRDYNYNGFTSIAYTRSINDGTTWAATNYVSPNSSYKQYPNIEVDSNNNVYITWDISSTNVFYIKSINSGTSWQTEARINTDGRNYKSSSIAADRNGNIHAVFIDKATNDLYYSKLSSGSSTWSTPVLIYNTNDAFEPTIAVDKNNILHVLWNASIGGVNQIMYSWASNVGISWSTPIVITTGAANQTKPNFIKDGSGYVWVGTTDNSKSSISSTGLMYYNYTKKVAPNAPAPIISDTGENFDARDLQVTFNGAFDETNIQEYRLFVVPTSQVGSFTVTIADGLASDRYYITAKNGNNGVHTVNLSSGLKDSNGTVIANNTDYKVLVYSVGTNGYSSNLSAASNALTLTTYVPSITGLIGNDIENIGDGTDIRVDFTGSSDETNISEYRVFIVPSPIAGAFTRAAAEGIVLPKYTVEAKNGASGSHSFTLTRTTVDINGDFLANGTIYKIFVLAMQQNGWTNTLSAGSDDLSLSAAKLPSRITITGAFGNNNQRNTARDSSGNLYITYLTVYNGYNHIFVRKSDDLGLTWKYWNGAGFGSTGSEVPIESSGNYSQKAPSMFIDISNNIYVVWVGKNPGSTTFEQVQFTKLLNAGGSWSASINISSSAYYRETPVVAVDNGGYIHVLWSENQNYMGGYNIIKYSKSTNGGTSWSSQVDLSTSAYSWSNPVIEVDSNNKLYAIWYDSTGMRFKLSTDRGTTWSASTLVGGGYSYPSAVVDRNGNLHLTLIQGSTSDLYYFRYDGTSLTWSSSKLLYSAYDTSLPSIGIDDEDILYIVFQANKGGVNQIMYLKSTDNGTSWSTPADLTSGTYSQAAPVLARDAFGYVWAGTTDSSSVSMSTSGIMFKLITKPAPTAVSVSASDVADNGDGRDIEVTFTGASNETNISGYRIFVIPSAQAGSFDANTASVLSSARYVSEAKNGNNASHTVTLTELLMEASLGDVIKNGTAYKVFVMSVGQGIYTNTLSSASGEFTLTSPAPTTGTPVGSDNANYGDGRDISVTFTGATEEAYITQYRVFVVPTSQIGSFDETAANSLDSTHYVVEAKNGNSGSHNISLTQPLVDSAGAAIANGIPYTIYVLSVGQNGYTNKLSSGSSSFKLLGMTNVPTTTAGPIINSTVESAGFNVEVGLGNSGASVGDTLELLLGGLAFGTPLTKVLDGDDISAGKYTFTISTGQLGSDGGKNITARIKSGLVNGPESDVLGITIDITGPNAPTADTPGGTFNSAQSISLTPENDAASTYYTLDGNAPDNTKLAYTGSIVVDGSDGATVTLKAVSYDTVGNKGSILTESYTFVKTGTSSSAPTAADTANYGDARDITYTFTGATDETNISEYRVIVVPTNQADTFDQAAATSLAPSRYEAIGKSGNSHTYSFRLSSTLVDTNGDNITNSKPYKICVLTVGSNGFSNILSVKSDSITLSATEPSVNPVGQPTVQDVGNNGDGRDISVTFTGVNDETNVDSYRIFVVNKNSVSSFDVTKATGLINAKYISETKNGNASTHTLTLTQNLVDTDGIDIRNNQAYKVFVLTFGANTYYSSLSIGSAEFTLAGAPAPSSSSTTSTYVYPSSQTTGTSQQSMQTSTVQDKPLVQTAAEEIVKTVERETPFDNYQKVQMLKDSVNNITKNVLTVGKNDIKTQVNNNVLEVNLDQKALEKAINDSTQLSSILDEKLKVNNIKRVLRQEVEKVSIPVENNYSNIKVTIPASTIVSTQNNVKLQINNLTIPSTALRTSEVEKTLERNANTYVQIEIKDMGTKVYGLEEMVASSSDDIGAKIKRNIKTILLNIYLVGDNEKVKLTTLSDKVEVGVDVPSYLKNSDRQKLVVYSQNGKFIGGNYDSKTKKLEFGTNESGIFRIIKEAITFNDIRYNPNKDYIEILASKHITDGISPTEFGPELTLNRSQIATFMQRVLEVDNEKYKGLFKDVEKGKWYSESIESIATLGLVEGVGNNKFAPEKEITNEELITILMRAYYYLTGEEEQVANIQVDNLENASDYAKDKIKAAYVKGILEGAVDTEMDPKAKTTREEAAKVLIRFINVVR